LPRGEATQQVDQVGTDISYSGTERILFVDDEETITRVSKQLLESIGYTVVDTTSSQKALDLFASEPDEFDLVVTDQTMPSMTGDELVTELLAVRPDVPIILCTGFSDRIDETEAHRLGVRHYLTKPTSLSTLSETIRAVLD
jgi:CheY-like chemotaxis protein